MLMTFLCETLLEMSVHESVVKEKNKFGVSDPAGAVTIPFLFFVLQLSRALAVYFWLVTFSDPPSHTGPGIMVRAASLKCMPPKSEGYFLPASQSHGLPIK